MHPFRDAVAGHGDIRQQVDGPDGNPNDRSDNPNPRESGRAQTLSPLERAAIEYVKARNEFRALKRLRDRCRCKEAFQNGPEDGGGWEPPCYLHPEEEQCSECSKRAEYGREAKLALAKSTGRSRAFFRAAIKRMEEL